VDIMAALLQRVQEFGRCADAAAEPAELCLALATARAMGPRARAQAVELSVAEDMDESGRLLSGQLETVISCFLRYLDQTEQHGSIALGRSRDEQRGVECLRVELSLPPGGELPSGRRALLEPWLEEPPPNASARLELALGLSSAQRGEGWFEASPAANGAARLTVFLPIR
jgi:hypothetical protein